MHEITTSCREAFIAALPLIPVFLILNRYRIRNWKRCAVYLIFSIYLSAMYAAVGLPDITYIRFRPHFNFIPFRYMFSAWETTLLNVLLFLPLGFFLTLLWKEYASPLRTVLFGFSLSLAIELLQIFTFRATDVNDLITNTIGTMVGYLLGFLTRKACPAIVPSENKTDLAAVCGVSFGVMFFVYPFLSRILL